MAGRYNDDIALVIFFFANISSLISIKPIAVHQNIQRAARNPVLVSKWISTRFPAWLMLGVLSKQRTAYQNRTMLRNIVQQ